MHTATLKKILRNNNLLNEYITVRKNEVEVYVHGDTDEAYEMNRELVEKVMSVLNWSGFGTGYGSTILREGYVVRDEDYCDRSSSYHY